MPGLYGYIKDKDNEAQLPAMKEAMALYPHYIHDPPFADAELEGARMHIGKIGLKTSPITHGDIYLWIEGEVYNLPELSADKLDDYILGNYKNGNLDNALAKVDGYFCAVLYDAKAGKVLFFTDRLGMRLLYLYHYNGRLAWASEVKALLALDFVDRTIDKDAPGCFTEIGFMLEDQTWFEHIKLIDPAMIVEFDIKNQAFTKRIYWSWAEIKPQNMNFNDAVDHLGELAIKSVKRRINKDEKIGIALSGGLDSRMLLAASQKLYPDLKPYIYTFGRKGSEDVRIAKIVAERAGLEHVFYEFTQENWYEPRKNMIWRTDGMFPMMHMHGAEFIEDIAQHVDITMNGYLGDLVLGGGLLTDTNMDQCITPEIASKIYKGQTFLARLDNSVYDIPHAEPHFFMNRCRRYTNMGTFNLLPFTQHRKPFMDMDILEFVFSIPDHYRRSNKLYSKMLLKTFPEFFNDIPWQKSGKTIDKPVKFGFSHKVKNKLKRIAHQAGIFNFSREYGDYERWIKSPEIASELEKLLSRQGSEYSDFMDKDLKTVLWEPHMNKFYTEYADKILRAATMEIYLRRVLRDNESALEN